MRHSAKLSLAVIGLAFAGFVQSHETLQAAEMKVTVQLTGAQEVPPTTSKGTGTAVLTLDAAKKTVAWKLTWKDLTGDAGAAHIHGPAAPGANAGVVVGLGGTAPLKQPLEGSSVLTDAQWADLVAGKDYINIHTAENKGGEVRGQIPAAK
jgi:hypothetical protein